MKAGILRRCLPVFPGEFIRKLIASSDENAPGCKNILDRAAYTDTSISSCITKKHCNLMNVTMICLGEDKPGEGSDLIQLLNTILISQEPVEKKLEVMSKRFGIAVNETMEAEMENMGSLSQMVYNQGLEQGRTEERKKVHAEREDGIRNLVISMSEENPSDKIAKYLVKGFSLSLSEAKKKVRMYMPKK